VHKKRKKERGALLVSQQHQCSFCQFCDAAKVGGDHGKKKKKKKKEDLAKFETQKNFKDPLFYIFGYIQES
jgi:hypothetical protein